MCAIANIRQPTYILDRNTDHQTEIQNIRQKYRTSDRLYTIQTNMYRQKFKPTDRNTDHQTEIQTDRQKYRPTNRHKDRHKAINIESV